jgi:hypothetical protein
LLKELAGHDAVVRATAACVVHERARGETRGDRLLKD